MRTKFFESKTILFISVIFRIDHWHSSVNKLAEVSVCIFLLPKRDALQVWHRAGSGCWLKVLHGAVLGRSTSSQRPCAQEPARGAGRARPPGGAPPSPRAGGRSGGRAERYVGARTPRRRGSAATDGVRGLGLGRDPAREGADRSVRPPRPAGHNQRGLRRPPLGEYGRCGLTLPSAGRARP